jgi:hypothetical protein
MNPVERFAALHSVQNESCRQPWLVPSLLAVADKSLSFRARPLLHWPSNQQLLGPSEFRIKLWPKRQPGAKQLYKDFWVASEILRQLNSAPFPLRSHHRLRVSSRAARPHFVTCPFRDCSGE